MSGDLLQNKCCSPIRVLLLIAEHPHLVLFPTNMPSESSRSLTSPSATPGPVPEEQVDGQVQ